MPYPSYQITLDGTLDTHKIPYIGFNLVGASAQSWLFKELTLPVDFYFVHSYRLLDSGLSGEPVLCRYAIEFLATYEQNNIFATQFHPEKSQTNRIKLLSNFLGCKC